MKRIPLICTSALLALALAGCGGTQTAGQAEYIGLDAANELHADQLNKYPHHFEQ